MTVDPTLVFRVTRAEQGARLDRLLHARIPWRSRTNLKALIEAGLVEVNGRRAKPASRLSQGDRVVSFGQQSLQDGSVISIESTE